MIGLLLMVLILSALLGGGVYALLTMCRNEEKEDGDDIN